MNLQLALLLFAAGALLVSAVTYGGMTWIYFKDKHRDLPPKPAAPEAVQNPATPREEADSRHHFHHAA